jgi:hypothetical protein
MARIKAKKKEERPEDAPFYLGKKALEEELAIEGPLDGIIDEGEVTERVTELGIETDEELLPEEKAVLRAKPRPKKPGKK